MWKKSTKTQTVEFAGGLDLTTSEMTVNPGRMRACQGWEVDDERGYKSARGFERFDGQTAPSESVFTRLVGTHRDLSAGVILQGMTSGATAEVLGTNDTAVFVKMLTGSFIAETAIDEEAVATFDGDTVLFGGDHVTYGGGYIDIGDIDNTADSEEEFTLYLSLTSELQRELIQPVPGEGPIRGVHSYKGVVYAFRDIVGGTACKMYKSSGAGWVEVTSPVLAPGGRYRFANYNFTGHSGTLKMYGCDGVNPGFEFDGTTFSQIATGMAEDAPSHVIGHKNHLFFAFSGGSLQHSSITDPATWSAVTGAAELSVGDEITDLVTTPGGLLVAFCRNSIHALYGSSAADWQLKTISDNYGAIEDTVQNAILPIYVGDSGVCFLTTTEKFGDFETDPISGAIAKLVKNYKDLIVDSVTLRHKNQYRLCFSNGEILVVSFSGQAVKGFTMLSYPIPIRCISSSLRSDRYLVGGDIEKDFVYFGSDDGYVYQMDSGSSFDGAPMYSFFRLPFFHGGFYQRSDGTAGINSEAATKRKTFSAIIVEAESESGSPVRFYCKPDYSFFQPNAPEGKLNTLATDIIGGEWNLSNWNEFYWGAGEGDTYYNARLDGTAPGVGLTFGIESTYQEPITIKSVRIKYRYRR